MEEQVPLATSHTLRVVSEEADMTAAKQGETLAITQSRHTGRGEDSTVSPVHTEDNVTDPVRVMFQRLGVLHKQTNKQTNKQANNSTHTHKQKKF